MALEVYSIASGSSGNCILLKDDSRAVLIDAGISTRRISAALRSYTAPERLEGILVTHEHTDHVSGAVRTAAKYRIPLIGNSATLQAIPGAEAVSTRVLECGEQAEIGGMLVRPFSTCHDAVCPVGYSIESSGALVVSATDTGIVPPAMWSEAFDADLLILESNHDSEMLRQGPYPLFLKRRIAGEQGHLSNDDAALLLMDLADAGRSVSVWLAHLSQTNNSPAIALASAQYTLDACLGATLDMNVALRDNPSAVWRQKDRPFQLSLFSPRLRC